MQILSPLITLFQLQMLYSEEWSEEDAWIGPSGMIGNCKFSLRPDLFQRPPNLFQNMYDHIGRYFSEYSDWAMKLTTHMHLQRGA
jgi:hypothetical protein